MRRHEHGHVVVERPRHCRGVTRKESFVCRVSAVTLATQEEIISCWFSKISLARREKKRLLKISLSRKKLPTCGVSRALVGGVLGTASL